MNSISNPILHLCGNLRQWIVAGVGGEADIRQRPKEFSERGPISMTIRTDGNSLQIFS
jgi:hypothetical protein